MLTRRALIALVTGLAVVVAASTASAKTPKDFFGVVAGAPVQVDDAGRMVNTGVSSYRFALNWSQVQPHRGPFDWSHSDDIVGKLAAQGIGTLPFMYGTPSWLASSPNSPPRSGRKRTGWKRFLKAAVERYGPGGSYWSGSKIGYSIFNMQCSCTAKPQPIRAWQIWNEPNFGNYWRGKPSAKGYARLVKTSHDAITGVDGHARIVLAGLKPSKHNTAWDFLDRMYNVRGIKRDFDATALHPYADSIAQLRTSIKRFRGAQERNHDGRTPLWMTELGWGSGKRSQSHLNRGLKGQKRMLNSSFRLIVHNRKRWNIGRLFWFSWRDGGTYATGSCDFCASAGLLDADAHRKPAFYAYRRFAK